MVLLLLAQLVAGQVFGYSLRAPRAEIESQAAYTAGDTAILCTEARCADSTIEEASLIYRLDGSLKYGLFVPVEAFSVPRSWLFLKKRNTKWCSNSEIYTDGEYYVVKCPGKPEPGYPFLIVIP